MALSDPIRFATQLEPGRDPLSQTLHREWRDSRGAWLRAEDALFEFRKRARRIRPATSAELLETGEVLSQRRDEALERMAELDQRREATWQAAAPEAGDAVPR